MWDNEVDENGCHNCREWDGEGWCAVEECVKGSEEWCEEWKGVEDAD